MKSLDVDTEAFREVGIPTSKKVKDPPPPIWYPKNITEYLFSLEDGEMLDFAASE